MSDLAAFHDRAWEVLHRGVADRDAAARVMALATVAADGAPEVRSVILRAADGAAGTVDVHTDARSAKVAALRAMPRAAAVVWDPVTRVQVRLSGEVAVLQGAAVAGDWDRVPRVARVSYGNDPAPGSPIAGPEDYVAGEGPGSLRSCGCLWHGSTCCIWAICTGAPCSGGRTGGKDSGSLPEGPRRIGR